jgi:hypothetical protein
MPQILVVADAPQDSETAVVYREWVSPEDFRSEHSSDQLIERVGWAVGDAEQLEHRLDRERPFED